MWYLARWWQEGESTQPVSHLTRKHSLVSCSMGPRGVRLGLECCWTHIFASCLSQVLLTLLPGSLKPIASECLPQALLLWNLTEDDWSAILEFPKVYLFSSNQQCTQLTGIKCMAEDSFLINTVVLYYARKAPKIFMSLLIMGMNVFWEMSLGRLLQHQQTI